VKEIIAEISKEVYKICKVVSNNNQLKDDLAQEVLLVLLEKEEEDIIDLHNRGKLLDYAFRIAWFKWNSNNGVPVGGVNNSNFKAIYRDYQIINSVELEDVHHFTREIEQTPRDRVNEIFKTLSTLERRTLQEYMALNLTMSNLANNTGISRSNLKIRLDAIFDKVRSV